MDDEQTKPVAQSKAVGRQDLVKRIANKAQISQKEASSALDATLESIQESLQNGNEVRLTGFGSFKVRQSATRQGVHPRDRTPIEIAAKGRVRFSPGKNLQDVGTSYFPPVEKQDVVPGSGFPDQGVAPRSDFSEQGGDSHIPPRPKHQRS